MVAQVKNKALSKEAFLKRRPIVPVTLSDGAIVHICSLPARIIIEEEEDSKKRFSTESLIVQSLCDENGTPFFEEAEKEKVQELSLGDVNSIIAAILMLNGLNAPKTGETYTAEKNS